MSLGRTTCGLLVCAILALAACSRYAHVKVDRVEQSDYFNQPAMASGGITVFGVTSVYGDTFWHPRIDKEMTRHFESCLRGTRPDLDVTPTADIERILGHNPMQIVRMTYKEHGRIAEFQVKALRQILLPSPRYLVFARLEQYGLETETHLKAVMAFRVYDLSTGEVVWSGELRHVREITYETRVTSDSQFEIVYGDEETEFWALLHGLFDKFSLTLPN